MTAGHSLLHDGRWQARRDAHGEVGSPKSALYVMARDFVPFATRIYYATVCGAELLEAHIQGRIEPKFPFRTGRQQYTRMRTW